MRTFIALELPPSFDDDVADLMRALRLRMEGRFVPRENLHLTLAFLGEVGEADAGAAIAALDAACAGIGPVPLAAHGLGSFRRRRDEMFFLDIVPAPELLELGERLRMELAARGLSFDETPFHPHVTLARRARVTADDLGDLPFPLPDKANVVTFFRSELSSEGARYKPLYRVEL